MGKYINHTSDGKRLEPLDKAQALINDGAVLLPEEPKVWEENLVCVVSNGIFDAAAYAHSPREMEYFMEPADDRPKVWLKYEKAKELAQ